MRVLSCEQADGEISAFGDDISVHHLSCGDDAGRHADGQPVDAERKNLLGVSRAIRCAEAACTRGEGIVHGLS